MRTMLVAGDLVSAYGWGLQDCLDGLYAGRTAIRPVTRFNTDASLAHQAASVAELDAADEDSLVWRMISRLLDEWPVSVPRDTLLILASTTGEIDLLERNMLSGKPAGSESRLTRLLERVQRRLGLARGVVASAACASSTVAAAMAAREIHSGRAESVLVVACDALTEFVFAGFSSLMALDPERAHPFDKNRRGLTVGEGAAIALFASEKKAREIGLSPLCEVAGWGMSCDANHMTGPSRDGRGLARAIQSSLAVSRLEPEALSFICAHGTGTMYNDAMEMKAFRSVLGDSARPTFSVKGGMGHTMGAAGLSELLITSAILAEGRVPPTVGLSEPDEDAAGWVSTEARDVTGAQWALTTNSGFGGTNAALVAGRCCGRET